MKRLEDKNRKRQQRKKHVRGNIAGSASRPRMSVFRSNRNLSVQIIDDVTGRTLVSASTLEKDLKKITKTIAGGEQLGQIIGERCKSAKIDTVVFDRNGYLYHGIVKAIADGARKAGIQF